MTPKLRNGTRAREPLELEQNLGASGVGVELGSSWSGSRTMITRLKQAHELHRQNYEAPKPRPRRDPERELESNLPLLSPSFCDFVTAKKVTIAWLLSPSCLFVCCSKVAIAFLFFFLLPFILVLLQ